MSTRPHRVESAGDGGSVTLKRPPRARRWSLRLICICSGLFLRYHHRFHIAALVLAAHPTRCLGGIGCYYRLVTGGPKPSNQAVSDSLRFQLEGTHKALIESGKSTTSAIGQMLILLAFSVLIISNDRAQGDDELFAIPILGLELSRWPAANIVLLLTAAASYRMLLLARFHQLRLVRLETLLEQAGWNNSTWAIEYPSLYTASLFLSRSDAGGNLGSTVGGVGLVGLLAATIGLPFGLLVHVFDQSGYSVPWLLAVFSYLLVVIMMIALTAASTPARNFNARSELN